MQLTVATRTLATSHRTAVGRGPSASPRRGPLAIDARLRARFRNGDPDAVYAVYSAYGRLVYAVAHAILSERGLCEEATQQTFVKAWRAAASLDRADPEATLHCAMAKRFATDAGFQVCNEALQLHGGYGYIKEYPIERYLRDVRVHQILEGTNEIMRVIIARRLLGMSNR